MSIHIFSTSVHFPVSYVCMCTSIIIRKKNLPFEKVLHLEIIYFSTAALLRHNSYTIKFTL